MPTPQLPFPAAPPTSADQLAASGPGSLPSVWLRAGARVLDNLIVEIPLLVLAVPYMTANDSDRLTSNFPHWLVITMAVAPIVYDLVFVVLFRGTPGKLLLGLEVRRYADGGRAAFHQAAYRAIVPYVGDVIALVWVADLAQSMLALGTTIVYLSAFFSPLLRGFHDRAAGTIVVRNR